MKLAPAVIERKQAAKPCRSDRAVDEDSGQPGSSSIRTLNLLCIEYQQCKEMSRLALLITESAIVYGNCMDVVDTHLLLYEADISILLLIRPGVSTALLNIKAETCFPFSFPFSLLHSPCRSFSTYLSVSITLSPTPPLSPSLDCTSCLQTRVMSP